MTYPTVIEQPVPLGAVEHDPFIDGLAPRAAGSASPTSKAKTAPRR